MIIQIDLKLTGDKDLSRALQTLTGKAMDRAIIRAVRYAGQAAKPAVAKSLRERYAITSSRVKADVSVSLRDGGRSAVVKLNDRPSTVMNWGAKITGNSTNIRTRKVKKGVLSWKILKAGGVKRSKVAWLMPGRQGGGLLPFHRFGKGRKDIDVIHGPSLRRSVLSGAHSEAIREEVTAVLGARLQSRLVDGIKQHMRGM
jgi:hypothetical protein